MFSTGHEKTVTLVNNLIEIFYMIRSTDPEDMENKYTRVLTCSLLAMRKLLQSLPPDQLESITEPLKNMLEDPKFWKHGKHKVNMVRLDTYFNLRGIVEKSLKKYWIITLRP